MATITTPAVISGEVIETSWGNSVRADLLALNSAKAELSGATFSGMVLLPATTPSSANHATRKGYVDTQDGVVNAAVALRALKSGDTFSGTIQVGGDASSAPGVRVTTTGTVVTYAGDSAAGSANVGMIRTGTSGAAPGERYINFVRSLSLDLIGSVSINGAGTGVLYNTTSDRRTKDDLGPLSPDTMLRRIMALTPRRLRGKATGVEFDGFIADEVQPVVPAAVTGEPGAMWSDDHPDADLAGQPRLQQFSAIEIITPLVGAVQALAARLDKLEGGGTTKARKAR